MEGFRPHPLTNEIIALLKGKAVKLPKMDAKVSRIYPTLIKAEWCPFTFSGLDFWNEAAHSVGLPLRIIDAESEEGNKVMFSEKVAGVPCLIAAHNHKIYGLNISSSDARSILQSTVSAKERK